MAEEGGGTAEELEAGAAGGREGEGLDETPKEDDAGEDSLCQICNMGRVRREVRGRWCWRTAFYSCGTCGATTNAEAVEEAQRKETSLKASIWLGPPPAAAASAPKAAAIADQDAADEPA